MQRKPFRQESPIDRSAPVRGLPLGEQGLCGEDAAVHLVGTRPRFGTRIAGRSEERLGFPGSAEGDQIDGLAVGLDHHGPVVAQHDPPNGVNATGPEKHLRDRAAEPVNGVGVQERVQLGDRSQPQDRALGARRGG